MVSIYPQLAPTFLKSKIKNLYKIRTYSFKEVVSFNLSVLEISI